MQKEMENEAHAMPVHMAGVNEPGREAGNDAFTVGLGLPWLQDTAEEMAGGAWGAEHFELVILDPDNVEVAVYNLIEYDLSDPANYEEIKRALTAIADRPDAHASGGLGGDMDPGAGGMHDMPDMHEGVENEAAHRDMGHDADEMPGQTSESCPADDAPVADMPMHGSSAHSHDPQG